jgi:hypothetical protein
MGRATEDDAAVGHANGHKPDAPVEATMSPWILELIRRFTLLDGTVTFDPVTFARRPLPAQ